MVVLRDSDWTKAQVPLFRPTSSGYPLMCVLGQFGWGSGMGQGPTWFQEPVPSHDGADDISSQIRSNFQRSM